MLFSCVEYNLQIVCVKDVLKIDIHCIISHSVGNLAVEACTCIVILLVELARLNLNSHQCLLYFFKN
jgi:hypothetical protein